MLNEKESDVIIRTRTLIREFLNTSESSNGFQVLFASESGSRAWGFESPDSDYDIRFVYMRPKDDYLDLDLTYTRNDNIRFTPPTPIIWGNYHYLTPLDFVGWDVFKFFNLIIKGNVNALDWLQSPDFYRNKGLLDGFETVVERVNQILENNYPSMAAFQHHRGLATKHSKVYLGNEYPSQINGKKYLYILRSLLACNYICIHQSAPPIRFRDLLNEVEQDSGITEAEVAHIQELLDAKVTASETELKGKREGIEKFIERSIESTSVDFHILISKTEAEVETEKEENTKYLKASLQKLFTDLLEIKHNSFCDSLVGAMDMVRELRHLESLGIPIPQSTKKQNWKIPDLPNLQNTERLKGAQGKGGS